jgi:hypothetical protein
VGGAAAGADVRSDGHAVDRATVGAGQAGGGPVTERQPVGIEQQDGAEHAVALTLDSAHELGEHVGEGRLARHQLMDPGVRVEQMLGAQLALPARARRLDRRV